jgi:hypothetical protein
MARVADNSAANVSEMYETMSEGKCIRRQNTRR